MTQVFLGVYVGIVGRYLSSTGILSCEIQESLELPVRKVETIEKRYKAL